MKPYNLFVAYATTHCIFSFLYVSSVYHMKARFRYPRLCITFSFLWYALYAHGQASTKDLATLVCAGIDPYFEKSHDTVSEYAPRCITRAILQDRQGHFWFATWQGIVEYDDKVFTNHTLKDGLIHFHPVSLFEDSKGNKWFGTARGGLYRYDGRKFTLFTKKNGLPDSTIVCMAEDSKGHVWFGTEEGGASCYDGRQFRTLTTTDGLSSNHVNAIAPGRNGIVYLGTMRGIDIYDGKTLRHLTRNGKPIEKITSLLQDSHGNLWIGRFDGLSRYDGHSFTDLLSPHLSYYISEDRSGNIWLAHAEPNTRYTNLPKQVLYKYDGESFRQIAGKDEPDDYQVFGNITDRDGNTWFGTMQGPCRYDGEKFTYFSR